MSNQFELLGDFESADPKDFKAPKPHNMPNKQKIKKANKKVVEKATKPTTKVAETFSTQHNKRGRGHVDRNRMGAPKRGGKIYDRSKPGKLKKGGAGKGNWGKNDGTAQMKAEEAIEAETNVAEETTATEEPTEETTTTEEEEQEEKENTISYGEYMKNQTGMVTKKTKNKIDQSNVDASLTKKNQQQ